MHTLGKKHVYMMFKNMSFQNKVSHIFRKFAIASLVDSVDEKPTELAVAVFDALVTAAE